MIKLVNISKKIDSKEILKNVSFELKKSEIMGIIGKSGSGKTTLAHIISNIIEEDSGIVYVNDKNKKEYTKKEYSKLVNLVFQEYSTCLNPKMKVIDVLKEIYEIRNEKIDFNKINEILKIVDLENIDLNIYSDSLSGGEKQRLNIARALIIDSYIYILDEVISSLDINLQFKILEIFKNISIKEKKIIILITHNIEILNYLTDNIWEMKNGKLIKRNKNR